MFWRALFYNKNWRSEKWAILAIIISFLGTGGIHFLSQRSILESREKGQQLTRNYDLNSKLEAVETQLLTMERNLQNYILSKNQDYYKALDRNMLNVQRRIDEIEAILARESGGTGEAFRNLQKQLQHKIDFQNEVLEKFLVEGKAKAELLINQGRGVAIDRELAAAISDFQKVQHLGNLEEGQKTGSGYSRSLVIDNIAFLFGIGLLLFACGYLIWSLNKRMILQEKLLQAKEEVERLAQIKEQFLANMSHEIRTPLQTILAYAGRLGKKHTAIEQNQYINAIQSASENLLNIVNDILDVSKIESGMMRLQEVAFSFSGLLHSVENMFYPRAEEKNIRLRFNPNPEIPDILVGDPTRLTQILVNLIGNSLKFTEAGKIEISSKILKQTEKSLLLKISVMDTGIGIPAEKLSLIFHRFEQADSRITRAYGGSGLGLHLVKQLVELQGGKIEVSSVPNQGSTFSFEIPFKIANKNITVGQQETNRIDLKQSFEHIKALLVEDNHMNQRVIGMFLSEWGIHFDLAENGSVAIQQLEKNHYDLILMDIQMPVLDGYSATEYIRENLQLKTPIIAMTAHAFAGEREKALSSGMNEYIPKPIKEEDLFDLIARFVPLTRDTKKKTTSMLDWEAGALPSTEVENELHIDYNFLLGSSQGKKGFLKDILSLFLQQAPVQLAALEEALAAGHFNQVKKTAHSLKSTVGYIGLGESLSPILVAVEKETRKQEPDPEKLEELLLKFKDLLERAILRLKSEILPLLG